jgi:hypothetical protein
VRVCVCVCERERERENGNGRLGIRPISAENSSAMLYKCTFQKILHRGFSRVLSLCMLMFGFIFIQTLFFRAVR